MEGSHEIEIAGLHACENREAESRMGAMALIVAVVYGAAVGAIIGFLVGRATCGG